MKSEIQRVINQFSKCAGCDSSDRLTFYKIDAQNHCSALCWDCRKGGIVGIPDVAYPYGSGTHSEENIAYPQGHPKCGQPIPFSDKRSKLEAMKLAGVMEAGDRRNGALNQTKRKTYFV